MSDQLATYSFLPWLRQGIANNIIKGDNDSSVLLRASITVDLNVTGKKLDGSDVPASSIRKDIELYGPGDIVGIDSKAIVKTEPRNWITNFEPNYLPNIEFYDEDFPWRYSPARPNVDRLRPWLTLVVLKEEEFEDGANMKDKPLPFFKMKGSNNAADIFPKKEELWAWAHVHINSDLSKGATPNTANVDSINSEMQQILNNNPDHAYSRILCPRKLEANVGYYAFLIPTFESGRLSGLGLPFPIDPVSKKSTLVATKCAWEDVANNEFPYYHRWYFRTGNVGDFEYLVNLLKPKPADKKIGVRDMDVIHPGSNLPPIKTPIELAGVLKLGGALKVPFDTLKDEDKAEVIKYDQWDENPYPHPFESAIAKRINLADDYTDPAKKIEDVNNAAEIVIKDENGATVGNDPDPVITLPLYGRWHSLMNRLLIERNNTAISNNKNWVHELNLDPRFRVSAGIGTKVVQKGQEEYMNAAWEQVGKIVEANNKIRMAQLAKEVSFFFYAKHVLPLASEKAFLFTAPVQKRVVAQGLTVHKQVQESVVPYAVTSGNFRSLIRPRGRTMKRLTFNNAIKPGNIIERINNGEVVVVPPKGVPPGVIKLSDGAEDVKPKNIPSFIQNLLKKYDWIKHLPLILLSVLLLIVLLFFRTPAGFSFLAIGATVLLALYVKIRAWLKAMQPSETLKQENQTPESVDDLPKSPDFVISEPGSTVKPTYGNTDSIESVNFKNALRDAYTLIQVKFLEPVRNKLDLVGLTTKVVVSINPSITIPKRTFDTLTIPARIKDQMVEKFTPVMVYPEIDVPMYKPLSEMSSELFLPNINLVEQNSITLLETNQKFIESYMIGINHEMSRELLWREFPTDQRGTYFRQFWDVVSFLPPQPVPDNIKENLRDIPPIHKWSKRSDLGEHNQREANGDKAQLVLVIRGELLKKYPTAVVYAQKADWGKNNSGVKDVKVERVFAELSADENPNSPTSVIKTPLFEAKVEPDIYFFGFDLTSEQAQGKENPTATTDDPGWFFVIKERPGEPRFGLDLNKADRIINWNNLSWKDIGTEDGKCIELDKTISFTDYDAAKDEENKDTVEDTQARWSPDTNAAELAYILYQVPVLVGVHASRMLPKS